jgi:sulfate adenylyltransferase subunit 1 (EFTu-like GTPase family)
MVHVLDFRFPVQYVIRPNSDFRGFAGNITSGTIMPGEEIIALPSGILNAQTYHDFQLEAEGLQNRSRYHEVPTDILLRI